MRVLVACKRGNIADRDKWGHCLCVACQAFRSEYRKANPRSEFQKQWREENKDKIAGYAKKWVENNKEKRKAVVNAWRAANPGKVAEMNAKAGKKWAAQNKGKRLASVRGRQMAKRLRTPAWANLEAICKIYEESARITKETGVPHEVDHVIPLQGEIVSGLHVPENLQILPRAANRSKGFKLCDA